MKFLRNLFPLFKKEKLEENLNEKGAIENIAPSVVNIPNDIDNLENIARFIFSPINVNPKNNNLKANCFKPPTGLDEVSVNRYDFTDASFLKKLGLLMQNPKKEFYGLAFFKCITVRNHNFDIIYTPIQPPIEPSNIFHSDVKIGHFVEKDVELPAEINEKIRSILKRTILYKDVNTNTEDWIGDNISLD